MDGWLWTLASVTVAVLLAAWSGYRSLMLLAAVYGAVIIGLWFAHVAP